MEIIWGYIMGPDMVRLLAHHWGNQHFVPKAGRFLGEASGTGIVCTQGDPASPMIFNIMVDAFLRAALAEVCEPQEAQYGLVWTSGERNLMFYVNYGQIAGRDHIWVKDALMVTV